MSVNAHRLFDRSWSGRLHPPILPHVNDLPAQDAAQQALSVSELNRQAKSLLERGLGRVWVEGEVSNLARPRSGHVYFSLKDEAAQLRCAWFRNRQRGPTISLEDGDQMLAFGQVTIYEVRGDYQLVVEQLEPAGEGELRRRFEALKKKLAAAGLFDEDEKQDLPELPGRVGVITSPSGAAVRDILSVLGRRFPAVPVVIYPTAVQGEAAAAEIVVAITTAVERDECDVLIVGRGGGSLEDLWPFNEEVVARALYDCPIPIVSAVGHEVDFSIADFVADVRAPTPSGAAELVVPDQAEWRRNLERIAMRFAALGRRYLEDRFQTLDWLSRRLSQASPSATVARQSAWLGNLQQVLIAAIRHDLMGRARLVESKQSRLLRQSPAIEVQRSTHRMAALRQRLETATKNSLVGLQQRVTLAKRALDAINPQATLDRGYAIVSDKTTGSVVRDAGELRPGAEIHARLARGGLTASVTEIDRKRK